MVLDLVDTREVQVLVSSGERRLIGVAAVNWRLPLPCMEPLD